MTSITDTGSDTDAVRPEIADAISKLGVAIGSDHVLTSRVDREWYAADFTDSEVPTPVAVVQPGSTEDVVEIVKIAGARAWRSRRAAAACRTRWRTRRRAPRRSSSTSVA